MTPPPHHPPISKFVFFRPTYSKTCKWKQRNIKGKHNRRGGKQYGSSISCSAKYWIIQPPSWACGQLAADYWLSKGHLHFLHCIHELFLNLWVRCGSLQAGTSAYFLSKNLSSRDVEGKGFCFTSLSLVLRWVWRGIISVTNARNTTPFLSPQLQS